MGVKGFQKEPQGGNHPGASSSSLTLTPHKHSEKRSKQPPCPTANSSSVFTVAAGSCTFKIWVKAALTRSYKQENLLCQSLLIPARAALAHHLAATSSSLVNIYCLPFKDLVPVQHGKLGSEYTSRGVRITRIKHKRGRPNAHLPFVLRIP